MANLGYAFNSSRKLGNRYGMLYKIKDPKGGSLHYDNLAYVALKSLPVFSFEALEAKAQELANTGKCTEGSAEFQIVSRDGLGLDEFESSIFVEGNYISPIVLSKVYDRLRQDGVINKDALSHIVFCLRLHQRGITDQQIVESVLSKGIEIYPGITLSGFDGFMEMLNHSKEITNSDISVETLRLAMFIHYKHTGKIRYEESELGDYVTYAKIFAHSSSIFFSKSEEYKELAEVKDIKSLVNSLPDHGDGEIEPMILDVNGYIGMLGRDGYFKLSDQLPGLSTNDETYKAIEIAFRKGIYSAPDILKHFNENAEAITNEVKEEMSKMEELSYDIRRENAFMSLVSESGLNRVLSVKDLMHEVALSCYSDLERLAYYEYNRDVINSMLFRDTDNEKSFASKGRDFKLKMLMHASKHGMYSTRQLDPLFNLLVDLKLTEEEMIEAVNLYGDVLKKKIKVETVLTLSTQRNMDEVIEPSEDLSESSEDDDPIVVGETHIDPTILGKGTNVVK